jgi:hypothetical protein
MPRLEWLRKEFNYGYDSGNVLSFFARGRRRQEEQRCGASYRSVFMGAARPYIKGNSTVMELGPGAGSWSRAILKYVPQGKLITVDFQDVTQWLHPERYDGRLKCCQVTDNSFSCIPDGSVDFFWSFGVLCHNNTIHVEEILRNALPKMKPGGFAAHQYADWDKLEIFGWGEKSTIPAEFKDKPDEEIWWPRNNRATMVGLAGKAGWQVVEADMGLVKRDGLILLRAPA